MAPTAVAVEYDPRPGDRLHPRLHGPTSYLPSLRRHLVTFALGCIVVLGLMLRLYHLSTVPTELIVDELDLYNSAYSIATTGHDVDGSLAPFLYSHFTRNPPMYAVAGYASSLVFGKNGFGLRFPAVIFGLAAIVLLYAIVLELTGRRDLALMAALFQATQPIFVQFSRIAWEPASLLPFLLAGLLALLRSFRPPAERSSRVRVQFGMLLLGALLLSLTSYTYMSGWFYAVLLGGGIAALSLRRLDGAKDYAKVAFGAVVWLLLSAPALWMCFRDPLTTSKIARVSTFAHGLSLDSLRIFALNYASHFYWSYLVTTGDPQAGTTWRYLDGFGAFYWWLVPLAAVGVLFGLRYISLARWRLWTLLWLVAYPLGGALTNDGAPNAPRTLAGAPVFCVLAALGVALLSDVLASLYNHRVSRAATLVARIGFTGSFVLSVVLFSQFYFTQYVHYNSNAWDSGTRSTFAAVRQLAPKYARVCFSIHPAWYNVRTYIRFYLSGVAIPSFDNVRNPACFLPRTLMVTDSDHADPRTGFTVLTRTFDVDGAPFAVLSGRP